MGIEEEILIVDKIKSGKSSEFETLKLYKKYFSVLYFKILRKIGNSYVAEEVAQVTLSKSFEKIHLYNSEKSKFSTWIHTIAHNEMVDYFRINLKHKSAYIEDIGIPNDDNFENTTTEIVDNGLLEDEALIEKEKDKEIKRILALGIKELNIRSRWILELFWFQKMSYASVAKETNLSEAAVRTIVLRAKRKIKRVLESKNLFLRKVKPHFSSLKESNIASIGTIAKLGLN